MKRIFLLVVLTAISSFSMADTMDHFMNIASNIPKMEMKSDPESQAWARSARNILILTSENVLESLSLANESAATGGHPLFCMPSSTKLSAEQMNELIQQTYSNLPGSKNEKDKMSVSKVALAGLTKQYPCDKNPQANHQASNEGGNPLFNRPKQMQHQGGLPDLG